MANNEPQRKTLTDRLLRALRPAPAGQRSMIWDAVVPGFGVRITDRKDEAGRAACVSFIAMRRLPGESAPTRATLGRYPTLPLAKAREKARAALGLIASGKKPVEEKRQERREKAERAAEATPYPFGSLVRALLLTGQRLSEIAEARWSEIEGEALTIPAERMKGKVAHVVPLTARMQVLLSSLPRFAGDYIFTTMSGRRPISGYSKMKARLDNTVAEIAAEAGARVGHFTIHDLRRTMRTGLAAAGVPVFDAELIIGHRKAASTASTTCIGITRKSSPGS
jgi:integrase